MARKKTPKPAVRILFYTQGSETGGKIAGKFAPGCSDPTCRHFAMEGLCTNSYRVIEDSCPLSAHCESYEAREESTGLVRVCR